MGKKNKKITIKGLECQSRDNNHKEKKDGEEVKYHATFKGEEAAFTLRNISKKVHDELVIDADYTLTLSTPQTKIDDTKEEEDKVEQGFHLSCEGYPECGEKQECTKPDKYSKCDIILKGLPEAKEDE